MVNEYAFFRGCAIPIKTPQIELAARNVLPKLGVQLVDVDEFTCCPDPITFRSASRKAWIAVAARNLAIAEKKGLDILTLCTGCAETLKEAAHALKEDKALREEVNAILKELGLEYSGKVKVLHIAELLKENPDLVKNSVTKKLKGIRVATHTGCHLLMPESIIKFDNPEVPVVLESLVRLTGATVVDYPLRIACCGSSVTAENLEASGKAVSEKLESINEAGADCLVVLCPSCFQQFDLGQVLAKRKTGVEYSIPVLYYIQLLGLAHGMPPEELGLQAHKVKTEALLEKLK